MRKISRSEYLAAFGLFTLAQQHDKKAREFTKEFHSILGLEEENGHLGDAVWDGAKTFDEALNLEGLEVASD